MSLASKITAVKFSLTAVWARTTSQNLCGSTGNVGSNWIGVYGCTGSAGIYGYQGYTDPETAKQLEFGKLLSGHNPRFTRRLQMYLKFTSETKFTVKSDIFYYGLDVIQEMASLMFEERYYDEEFAIQYFARDIPLPEMATDCIIHPDILEYLGIPYGYPMLSKADKERIKTLFLCRLVDTKTIGLLPPEIMFLLK